MGIVISLVFGLRLCYLKRSLDAKKWDMGTRYWERDVDVQIFMPIVLQNILFLKSLMKSQQMINYVSNERLS